MTILLAVACVAQIEHYNYGSRKEYNIMFKLTCKCALLLTKWVIESNAHFILLTFIGPKGAARKNFGEGLDLGGLHWSYFLQLRF